MGGKLSRLAKGLALGSALLFGYALFIAVASRDLFAFVLVGIFCFFAWGGIVKLLLYLSEEEPDFNLDEEPHPNRFVQIALDSIEAKRPSTTDRIIGEHSRQQVTASKSVAAQGKSQKDPEAQESKEWAEMTRLL